ncbi:MAG: SDR family NAD(P)-dependent oxidoreductase [Spirochaetota bacterium]
MGTNVRFDFSGKRVFVTGATRGIGRGIALAFAASGAQLVAAGRDGEALQSLSDEIENAGGVCETHVADLSSARQTLDLARDVVADGRVCDVLVNNAGLNHLERLVDLTVEHWDEVLNVNLRAPALISSVIGKHMVERGGGAIVHVASLSSVVGLHEHAAYCSSKFGLQGLTQAMAVELGPHNVRVNSVGPTVVLTPMGRMAWSDPAKADPMKARIPLGRFATVDEVTDAVLFLSSDAASMIHGQILLVDGGFTA